MAWRGLGCGAKVGAPHTTTAAAAAAAGCSRGGRRGCGTCIDPAGHCVLLAGELRLVLAGVLSFSAEWLLHAVSGSGRSSQPGKLQAWLVAASLNATGMNVSVRAT